ncbi:unnamed protein product (macronuclear) [Paramecium tetraurelia]|uniref:Armadillo-type fold n=1 Tax=Paramecium tetraurelia TaxID=5888 RepID=A0C2H2_PARTE|nr:uncharacterized protein GSPATT00034467001 [Paramecium tetraurelia]CAK64989.1 unnamed protein product [Paramecium tetraurelia]|eukprot:XP_001432386.1 hypothetical protein (macronuclear) [Paramecium tetraurelia strain d4-2]
MDEIKLVESDNELQYQPQTLKNQKQIQPKSIYEMREQFRLQIRKERIEEQLEKKRMWFIPKQRLQGSQMNLSINNLFNEFKIVYAKKEMNEISQKLHLIANIIDDRNRIHSLYLTQRNFLQFKDLLNDESYYIDTFTIYLQLTQDEEYFQLPFEDIQWSIERSLELLIENKQIDDLANLILGYLGNVSSKLAQIQHYLLSKNTVEILCQLMKDTLLYNVSYLIQTLCRNIPEQFKPQLIVILKHLKINKSQEILQTLFIINKQCDQYDRDVNYFEIFQLLFNYLNEYLTNENDFESFYSALLQMKYLSDFQQLYSIFQQFSILEIINKLINYKYQKIRTAVLYILQNLCKQGHNVIQQIFSQQELIKKLINILTTDKPINQSLVIRSIQHILKYGNQLDFTVLINLGLAIHLKSTVESAEPYIVLQGLECITSLMNYGLSLQSQQNVPNPILAILQQNQLIQAIEDLQYHPNKEIFDQSQKLITEFFRTE